MLKHKFTKLNKLMGNIFMSEEITLEVILSDQYRDHIPNDLLNFTPDDWAKYAFENNLQYVVTYFQNEVPIATCHINAISINISFFETMSKEPKSTFSINFMKGYIDNKSKNYNFVTYENNKVFLSQIDSKVNDLGKSILFYSNKKKDNVFLEEFVETNGNIELIEQFGTADLSKHWFDAPSNYLDFERFLDYQKLFDELPKLK